MKTPVILIVCLAFCVHGKAQAKSEWKQMSLKGKVKSLKSKGVHRYKKDGKFTPWEPYYGFYHSFNATGNRTEYRELLGNDSVSYRMEYKYSPKEKRADVTYFDKQSKPGARNRYVYDANGNKLIDSSFSVTGTFQRRYVYTYDARGNNLTVMSYEAGDKLNNKTTYTYDAKGNVLTSLVETPGYANSGRQYVYDDKGNRITEVWLNGQGAVDFRFERTYDANGNVIKEVKYRGDILRDTVTFRYEYDSRGNWIKKTDLTSAGEEYHIEERTILYY